MRRRWHKRYGVNGGVIRWLLLFFNATLSLRYGMHLRRVIPNLDLALLTRFEDDGVLLIAVVSSHRCAHGRKRVAVHADAQCDPTEAARQYIARLNICSAIGYQLV